MMEEASQALLLLEALGIGLLIGIERERNGGENGGPAPIGVRTFSLASLIGALSQYAGGQPLLAVALAAVGVLRAVAHLSQTDRQTGMTTSLALVLVVVLQLATAPVGAHLIGRAAYASGDQLSTDTVIDGRR